MNTVIYLRAERGFLTDHAWACHTSPTTRARDRDIAASAGITERHAHGIITERRAHGIITERRAHGIITDVPGPITLASDTEAGFPGGGRIGDDLADGRLPCAWLGVPAGEPGPDSGGGGRPSE